MKRQDITYQDKLDEMRLYVEHPNNKGLIFIFVEGESDIRLFRKLFNENFCKVESVPGGNTKVEEIVDELIPKNKFIIGIRDADFIHLTNPYYFKENIFLTDFHDIEMTIAANNNIFSAVMSEYTAIPKEEHNSVRDFILKTIQEISYLKWWNEIDNLNLSFDKTEFQHLLNFKLKFFNFEEYVINITSKSPQAKVSDIETIKNKINEFKEKNIHHLHLTNA